MILRTVDVTKRYRRGIWPFARTIPVLRGASLEIRASELAGLVGENGSGKSTLMQIVVGLLGRDGGEVERPARLGYCPQLPMLWDKLTVDEHFALFAQAYGLEEEAGERAGRRRCWRSCSSPSTAPIGSRSSLVAPARSSTWRLR